MESESSLSIVDVLQHYGATTVPEGVGWRTMNCPFHGDTHASARVNTGLNAFKCHGCNVSGDAIKIIETQEKIGYSEAIGFAESVLGQSVETVSRTVHGKAKPKQLGSKKWKDILA